MRPSFPAGIGPFRASDAHKLGLTRADLRSAERAGLIVRLRRNVLVTAADRAVAATHPSTLHAQDVQALRLAMRRDRLVAAGASAARIHGLDLRNPPGPELIVVTDDPRVSGTHRDGYFLRRAYLPDEHIEVRHGVPVTTVARTLIDIAAHLGFDDGVVATESAYRRKLITPASLMEAVAQGEGRPGIVVVRDALDFAHPATESFLESISRISMREAGVPMPECQVVIVDDGVWYIRVDFLWPRLRLIGEADGMAKYATNGRDPLKAVREQHEREQRARDEGFDIVRWDYRTANNSRLLAARLLPALARAAERGGRTV